MNHFRTATEKLSGLLLWITIVCLLLMMVNITADIVLRTLFDIPVPATAELTAFYYMVGAVFLPLPLVELRDESIRVDLFYNMSPRVVKTPMIVIAYLAQFVFFALMFWQTGIDAIEAFVKDDFVDSQIKIYVWPGRFFLPMGFGMAAVVSVLKLVEHLLSGDLQNSPAKITH